MDDLQYQGLMLFQDDTLACFDADALLLLDFLRVDARDRVLELGCGTGVICVLGQARTGARFTGVDRQERLIALAKKSAAYNQQAIGFHHMEASDAPNLLGRGAFSAVAANPPYFETGDRSQNPSRALARHGAPDTLTTFLDAAFQLLDNGGRLFLIYPASALIDLVGALRSRRLEPKRMRFVRTKSDENAKRVLIEARKHGGAGLVVEPSARY